MEKAAHLTHMSYFIILLRLFRSLKPIVHLGVFFKSDLKRFFYIYKTLQRPPVKKARASSSDRDGEESGSPSEPEPSPSSDSDSGKNSDQVFL